MENIKTIFRWKLAHLLDYLPFTCWAELAMYGLGHVPGVKDAFNVKSCKQESIDLECKSCYCGKFFCGRLAKKSDYPDVEEVDLPF